MRNMYNITGIDLAAQRSSAIKHSKSNQAVTIHMHKYGETCTGYIHEYYLNGDKMEQVINYVPSTELRG